MNGVRVLKFGVRIIAPTVPNDEDDGAFLLGRHANSFLLHIVIGCQCQLSVKKSLVAVRFVVAVTETLLTEIEATDNFYDALRMTRL